MHITPIPPLLKERIDILSTVDLGLHIPKSGVDLHSTTERKRGGGECIKYNSL